MRVNTIVVYDVRARNSRTRRALKKWLNHGQRSVFTGSLTAGQRLELAALLKRTAQEDGETIFMFSSPTEIEVIAVVGDKPTNNIL